MQDIRYINAAYSRPNGGTDFLWTFKGGWGVFQILFSNFFFRGQRRALQPVIYNEILVKTKLLLIIAFSVGITILN